MDRYAHPIASDSEMLHILAALTALKKGVGSIRLPSEWTGLAGKVADAFNDVVDLNERMSGELARLSRSVGREGNLKQRASMGEVGGFWADSIDSVNALIDDLVHPTSEIARVIGEFAQGDSSQTMAIEVDDRPRQGEFLRAGGTINGMVDQPGSFASEGTRTAREAGSEGKPGGQAKVIKGVADRAGKRNRVLVLDDNEDFRVLMQLALRAENFEVSVAANGRDGMSLLRKHGADVVVTDIMMPEQDGIETIAELRREFPDVKIIAVSGAVSGTGFDYLRVPIELGVARVLRKPFAVQDLVRLIRN